MLSRGSGNSRSILFFTSWLSMMTWVVPARSCRGRMWPSGPKRSLTRLARRTGIIRRISTAIATCMSRALAMVLSVLATDGIIDLLRQRDQRLDVAPVRELSQPFAVFACQPLEPISKIAFELRQFLQLLALDLAPVLADREHDRSKAGNLAARPLAIAVIEETKGFLGHRRSNEIAERLEPADVVSAFEQVRRSVAGPEIVEC